LFILFTAGSGTVVIPFPCFVFEVIADLSEFFAGAGNDLGIGGRGQKLCGEGQAQELDGKEGR
jgi:hypothetical protein